MSSMTDPLLWTSACVPSKQLVDILILALQLLFFFNISVSWCVTWNILNTLSSSAKLGAPSTVRQPVSSKPCPVHISSKGAGYSWKQD